MLFQGMSCAFGCDQNSLDSHAIELSSKIYNAQKITKEMIIENLDFVYDQGSVANKYKETEEQFKTFTSHKKEDISNAQFDMFTNLCNIVYSDGDFAQKIATYMLFEKVSNKVQSFLTLQQRRKASSTLPTETETDFNQNLQAFLNIDKGNIFAFDRSIVKTH